MARRFTEIISLHIDRVVFFVARALQPTCVNSDYHHGRIKSQ